MDIRQRILAVVVAVFLLGYIIDLVRRRKLKQEFAWLWIVAGILVPVVGLNYGLLQWITRLVGAGFTSSTLFFFSILFVVALCLQFSVKISALENRVKNLAQDAALRNVRRSEHEKGEHLGSQE